MLERIAVLILMFTMTAITLAQADVEAALLQQTNMQRSMQGLPAVQPDEALARAARRHAAEMAELGYLAHQSPRPENRTLALRLNQAGAVVQSMAENLAMLSGVPDQAAAAVSGWMDSPGHRRNLLGDYTHVGFGVATNNSGTTYVVQVLGLQTVTVTGVSAVRSQAEVYVLEIDYVLSAPREVAFWTGEDVSVPGMMPPGSQQHTVRLDEPRLLHVSSGVRQSGGTEEGVFIAADGGWFDPEAGTWTPSESGNGTLTIRNVSGSRASQELVLVAVELAEPLPGNAGVWLDDDWFEDVTVGGTVLQIRLPAPAVGSVVRIGLEEPAQPGSYAIVLSLEVVTGPGGLPDVRVLNPGS